MISRCFPLVGETLGEMVAIWASPENEGDEEVADGQLEENIGLDLSTVVSLIPAGMPIIVFP